MVIIKPSGGKNVVTTSSPCHCYCDFASAGYAADCGEEAHGCACQCAPGISGTLVDTATNLP
jgi:hypothetical protein